MSNRVLYPSASISRRDTIKSAAGIGSLGLLPFGDTDGLFGQSIQQQANAWEQQTTLSDEEKYHEFGDSVSIDGNTAVIGSPESDTDCPGPGYAYVFTRQDSQWTQQATLEPDDPVDETLFGTAVAISGDTVIVGAPKESLTVDGRTGEFGTAYVFVRQDGQWTQTTKLAAENPFQLDYAGVEVAIDGDTAFVAASGDPYNRSQGAVFVFARQDGQWTQEATLTDDTDYLGFGESVAVSGDTGVVGHVGAQPYGELSGQAYVYRKQNGHWQAETVLVAEDGELSQFFGESVSTTGDEILVGAHGDTENGYNAGAAYVFTPQEGRWNQTAKLLADDGDADDAFGHAVAMHGETAVVGASADEDPNGTDAGSASVFTSDDDGWTQTTKLADKNGESEDNLGQAVATTGDTALVGAHGNDPGSVVVFAEQSQPSSDSTTSESRLPSPLEQWGV